DIPNQRPHMPQNDFTVTAPLPGTVVDVWVKPGQKVSQGQVLLIIEAMKMENEIQAPFDGVVHEIMVQAGSSVTGGQPLVRLGH
ncbi:MAG: acetyl-CoA carboxylase biotin carboxyl carrier protein subunit, partial [Moorella sp. (in: firmicutes)]